MSVAEILRGLFARPAWGGFFDGAVKDHTAPDAPDLRVFGTSAADVESLKALGIRLDGRSGEDNLIIAPPAGARRHGVRVRFNGRSGNVAVLGAEGEFLGDIGFEGDRHALILNGRGTFTLRATFRRTGGAAFVGRNSTSNGTAMLIEGPGRCITVGDDCMFAANTALRTSDSHGIVRIEGPEVILNPPASVRVAPHVWLGEGAVVGRGRRVGRGAIIGMRAVVTRDVEARTLVAGRPARVRKKEVT